jgi:hypothetical protein
MPAPDAARPSEQKELSEVSVVLKAESPLKK